jgi:hypothetical protein
MAGALAVLASTSAANGQSLLEVARHEVGVKQSSPRVAVYLNVLSTADWFTATASNGWCGAYVQWSLKAAGLPLPATNQQPDWMHYGAAVTVPQPGDVAVFAHHVAFFLASRGEEVCVLGGAQSQPGQEPSVCGLWVNRASVQAFRRPVAQPSVIASRHVTAAKRNAS